MTPLYLIDSQEWLNSRKRKRRTNRGRDKQKRFRRLQIEWLEERRLLDAVTEDEPNDTLSAATVLPLTEDPGGSGYFAVHGLGSIEPSTDVDYWSFEALAGDIVSVSVNTPGSALNPYVELHDASGSRLAYDFSGGPDGDAFISHRAIGSSGTYYVRVNSESSTSGSYQVRVDVARGIQLESDVNYSNDSITSANMLMLSQGATGHLVATVAGTVMSPEALNTDEDRFGWLTLNAGSTVELNVRLPSTSTLAPRVRLVGGNGADVADDDGDPLDGHFRATIAAEGDYYALVESRGWSHNGHLYLATDTSMTWTEAETHAQSLGGHLVTVNDQAENDWLQQTFDWTGDFWIGLTDEATEGTWQWSSSEPAAYTNWADGEPNDEPHDHAYLQSSSGGEWCDASSPTTLRGVIELGAPGIVEGLGPGPSAQYLLDVDLTDVVLPPGLAFEGTDNDTLSTATALPLAEAVAGSGYFVGHGLGAIQPEREADWWRFEALAGDVISIAMDSPLAGGVGAAHVTLYDENGISLASNDRGGPDNDAFISHYELPGTGTYYICAEGKYYYRGYRYSSGSYEVRVDVARGIQLESDGEYANDTIAGADILELDLSSPGHLTATVAGTMMDPQGSHQDQDLFALGTLSAGNVVELDARLPSTGSLSPRLVLVDASGAPVADGDGDPTDDHFLGTIATGGEYYARVEPIWSYGGHGYVLTDGNVTWSAGEAYARSLGGHLVTVNDPSEQDWLHTTFAPYGWVWIGLTDEAGEGTWEWSSGEAVAYTNWASGEPSSQTDYNWACLSSSNGEWYDQRNGAYYRGLVELSGSGVGGQAGPWAQYLLDVDIADEISPVVTSVSGLPANGDTTDGLIHSFTVNLSEYLDAATVNPVNRFVGSYDGHYYVMTPSSLTWTEAEAYAQSLVLQRPILKPTSQPARLVPKKQGAESC